AGAAQPGAAQAQAVAASRAPRRVLSNGAPYGTPTRFAAIPGSDNTASGSDNTAPAPARPRLRLDPTIGVTAMRLMPDAPEADAQTAAAPAKCALKILHEKPAAPSREVAIIKLSGAPAQHEVVWSLLKRKACEAGANAVLVKNKDRSGSGAAAKYTVDAVALVVEAVKPAVREKPVPKTITVPAAAPKTIELDADTPSTFKETTIPAASAPATAHSGVSAAAHPATDAAAPKAKRASVTSKTAAATSKAAAVDSGAAR
ncbi:MAG TPA: hypothetical protein VNF49_12630, partial [Candidatus Binataceae bacterium]|nr:hypothetical protein [Candidatus Binataceae bacterium]